MIKGFIVKYNKGECKQQKSGNIFEHYLPRFRTKIKNPVRRSANVKQVYCMSLFLERHDAYLDDNIQHIQGKLYVIVYHNDC